MHVLLRQDVLQHLFGRLSANFKNTLEYKKWSCVCRTWFQAERLWCAFAIEIIDDFKMQCLPVISASKNIPAVIHVMTKYMWDYETIIDCLALLIEWTSNIEGAICIEVGMGMLIDGSEEEMEENDDEVMEENDDEVMEEGGVEDVVVETETQTIKEEMDDLDKQRKESEEINENLQLSNDQVKDDMYEVADINNKVDIFDSLVYIDSEVKRVVAGHVLDAATLVEFNNMVVMIVQVMKEFQIVYHNLVDVKILCLQCLANLAAFNEVRLEMGTRAFFHEIVSTIESIKINVDIGRGVNVLMAVCEGNDVAKQAFIDEGGFLFLAKLSRQCNESKYIDFDICLLVFDLCKREGDVLCMREINSAVIGFLCHCAAKYVDTSRFMHNVSRTIHFVVTNMSNKKELVKNGGMQVMETVLAKYSDNPVVREFISAALDNMRSTLNI